MSSLDIHFYPDRDHLGGPHVHEFAHFAVGPSFVASSAPVDYDPISKQLPPVTHSTTQANLPSPQYSPQYQPYDQQVHPPSGAYFDATSHLRKTLFQGAPGLSSRASSHCSFSSSLNGPSTPLSGDHDPFQIGYQYHVGFTPLPSAREFMAGAASKDSRLYQVIPSNVPRLPPISSLPYGHTATVVSYSGMTRSAQYQTQESSMLRPLPDPATLFKPSFLEPHPETSSLKPEAPELKRRFEGDTKTAVAPKKSKQTTSFRFTKDSNALFFSNTKLDYRLITSHLARECTDTSKYNIDWSKPDQTLTISENDLIRWTVLEFLYTDIKLYDRRYDTTPLIHDTPENRFDVTLEFVIARPTKTKNVKVSMTLLKPSSSKISKKEISTDLGRILTEVFMNHKKEYLGKKRKWSSTRPQWGLGSDNELSIIEINFDIRTI